MSELLLELFSEEIPARMQETATADLARLVTKGMADAGLAFGEFASYATPRRLTLVVRDVAAGSEAVSEERKGPRVGAPEKAIEGFLRGAGLASIDDAEVVSDAKKGDFYVARTEKPGRDAGDIIAGIVPGVITKFPWPKSMEWGNGGLKWVRPLHSIACLLDDAVVPFEVAGITSGNTTHGHRFMGKSDIVVSGAVDYAKKLASNKVILDAETRMGMIRDQALALAQKAKLEWVTDEALVAENAGLNEWPTVLMGSFDDDFLGVPSEVLTTSMKSHQKCFSLRDPKSGKLANKFLLVTNLEAKDGGKAIVAGNERVIRARLADAKFFWDKDLATPLDEMANQLDQVTFHEKLGTQKDRVERVQELAFEIAKTLDVDAENARRAAQICKADLVSEMVGEFPELQGLIGRYYEEAAGGAPEIARAVELHYKPKGPTDTVPTLEDDGVSVAVALADKLDTLVGFWAIDEKPTGSGDPYALRRAALGVVRLCVENDLRLNLNEWLGRSLIQQLESERPTELQRYCDEFGLSEGGGPDATDIQYFLRRTRKAIPARWWNWFNSAAKFEEFSRATERDDFRRNYSNPTFAKSIGVVRDAASFAYEHLYNLYDEFEISEIDKIDRKKSSALKRKILRNWHNPVLDNLLSFFADRLKVFLRDRGQRHDLIDAVFSLGGQDDLALIVRRVEALGEFLETDDGANLLAGVKRAQNILTIEEKKDKASHAGEADATLLDAVEEKTLHAAIAKVSVDVSKALDVENFGGAMRALAELRAPVDAFFDNVIVNADDAAVRANRLKLLSQIRAATQKVADFSKIEG